MAILVILVLVILWAAVLVPPILRSRNSTGLGGVSDFMDSLRSLGGRNHQSTRGGGYGGPVLHGPVGGAPIPTGPTPRVPRVSRTAPAGGGAMSPMQRRRRNVLFGLAGLAGLTFVLAMATGSTIVWLAFLLSLGALGGYVYLLLQFKQQRLAGRGAAPRRVYAPPVDVEEQAPRIGDNVILLRRTAG